MSTTVTIVNEDEFNHHLGSVRDDDSDTNWFLCGHTDSPDELEYVGSGSGGVEELAASLDVGRYMYGIVRMTVTIDMSATTKFAYIAWIGKEVPFTRRGKFGVKSGAVKSLFNPYQVSFEFDDDDVSAVTEEAIRAKLEDNSGTKDKILDASLAKDRPERGFTSGASNRSSLTGGGGSIGKVGKQGSSYSGISSTAKGGSSVKYDPDVEAAIAAVRSDEDDTNWICVKFTDNNLKKPLYVFEAGDDCAIIGEKFGEDEVACALLRMSDVVDDITTVKFIYILWVGEKVKPMSKGRISTCKGDLEELFQPFHVHIHATHSNEVRYQLLQDKVGSASGSKSNIK